MAGNQDKRSPRYASRRLRFGTIYPPRFSQGLVRDSPSRLEALSGRYSLTEWQWGTMSQRAASVSASPEHMDDCVASQRGTSKVRKVPARWSDRRGSGSLGHQAVPPSLGFVAGQQVCAKIVLLTATKKMERWPAYE
jgi:hypothetical protein